MRPRGVDLRKNMKIGIISQNKEWRVGKTSTRVLGVRSKILINL